MPNVSQIRSSPPPGSGNVEDPCHLQNLGFNQASIETKDIYSPSTVTYSGNHLENTPDKTVYLQYSQFKQKNVLSSADVAEGGHGGKESHTENFDRCEEKASVDQECGYERSRSREDVIKEIAISSTAFIGPACRSDPAIEQELSEFYKELEEIDHQDSVDGKAAINEVQSQFCAPATDPSPKNKFGGSDHKNAYRPYPATRPQREYGNDQRWRPQSHNDMPWDVSDSYNNQRQWQHPPPRLPYNPSRFQFHGPQHFCPPPQENPMRPPYFQPQPNNFSHADNSRRSSWEQPHFPLVYDNMRFPSNYTGSFKQYKRNPSDRQPHEMQNYPKQDPHNNQHNKGISLVLILMRGVPGSGKSTLAKEILSSGPNGLILSTDDYFLQKGFFDPTLLGDAHDWNHKRAKDAMLEGRSPIIIDNTNVQAWEMKPYVALALDCGYRVDFVEPDTSWKCDPAELEKRNKHGVPKETIAKMLNRFELPISVDVVMNSCEPPHKSKERLPKQHGWKRYDDF